MYVLLRSCGNTIVTLFYRIIKVAGTMGRLAGRPRWGGLGRVRPVSAQVKMTSFQKFVCCLSHVSQTHTYCSYTPLVTILQFWSYYFFHNRAISFIMYFAYKLSVLSNNFLNFTFLRNILEVSICIETLKFGMYKKSKRDLITQKAFLIEENLQMFATWTKQKLNFTTAK